MSKVKSEAMSRQFSDAKKMTIRQTRKGWCQEILGCQAMTEFKWFNTTNELAIAHFATSTEHSPCMSRFCCKGCQRFQMEVKEEGTGDVIFDIERPWKCAGGPCKCCCFQELKFTSQGQELGKFKERCYCCLPQSVIKGADGEELYLLHPPSCCGGCCMDCCADTSTSNCCMQCLGCTIPFHIFKAGDEHGSNAKPAGKVTKKMKSLATELFTDANAFDVEFPENATTAEKAMIAGSTILINEMFFEDDGGLE